MTGRIITVRHGKPDLSRAVLLSAKGYGEWWARYDKVGLVKGQVPRAGVVEVCSDATHYLSSPMPRAYETALTVSNNKIDIIQDAIFVEAPLPPPPWWDWMLMSPRFWGLTSRIYWLCGYIGGGRNGPVVEHRDVTWQRVDKIVDRLIALAEDGDVVLCAHGYLNWIIYKRLKLRSWQKVEHKGGNKYWSWRVYRGPNQEHVA